MEQGKRLVVVGGGISGLCAALTWAKHLDSEANPVTVLEKQSKTGGYVTTYTRGGFDFDTCQMIPDIGGLLEYFGVEVELRRFEEYFARVVLADPASGKTQSIDLPSGVETFKQAMHERFPADAQALDRFIEHSRAMYLELFKMKMEPTPLEIVKMLFRCHRIVRNVSKTFDEYLCRFGIDDPDLRSVLNVFAEFSGLPADEVAALVPISAMNSLLDGACRPRGGFIELPKALETRLKELGGQVRTGAAVERILVCDGKVEGVRLAGGEVLEADYVITTVDPKVAMKQLVGLDLLRRLDRRFVSKLESARMSSSSFNVSLGLDEKVDLAALGLDCGYTVITTGGDTFDRLYRMQEEGTMGFSRELFNVGVVCPSTTTGGKQSIMICVAPIRIDGWALLREEQPLAYRQEKEKWGAFFIDLVERYLIPDLKKHIVLADYITPATYARYSGSPTGSIYDMAPYPDNFGAARLPTRTPVEGLFQPKFVHGVFGCMLGGIQAVDMILERRVMGGNARL
jgi:phytoene dehydrogenase-like protein